MAASVPTFQLSEQDEPSEPESEDKNNSKTKQKPQSSLSTNKLLSVPAPIRSNIGVNNPNNQLGVGQFPLAGSQQIAGGSATGNPRNKVALAKGFSLMDWIRLSKSGKDLTGVGGPMVNGKIREVTRNELKKHKKRKDAWIALNGAVYNVTHYMDFHPGGWDELVRGAGKDATDLFNEVHKWVNYQGLLEACLVGKLVDGPSEPEPVSTVPTLLPPPPAPGAANTLTIKQKVTNFFSGFCTVLPPIPTKPPSPTMDYFQTDTKLTVNIYTKRRGLSKHNVIIDNEENYFKVTLVLPLNEVFIVHVKLLNLVKNNCKLRIGAASGKIEIDLEKLEKKRWMNIGTPLDQHLYFGDRRDHVDIYRMWTVSDTCHVTHNTKYIVMSPPDTCHFHVAPGHHVQFRTTVEDTEIVRSYTPVVPLDNTADNNLHFLIKIYPDGAMTPGLSRVNVGDHVMVSDHMGTFSMSDINCDNVCLLAAGTGITPMLSILPSLATLGKKKTVRLVTFDRSPKDIIWKTQVNSFQEKNSDWLSVMHVVSDTDDYWAGDTGRISVELLNKYINDNEDTWVAVCGPPGFNREAVRLLKSKPILGDDKIHVFEG